MNDRCLWDANMINQALFDTKLDADIVMEIICTRSSSELKIIKQTYYNHYITPILSNMFLSKQMVVSKR